MPKSGDKKVSNRETRRRTKLLREIAEDDRSAIDFARLSPARRKCTDCQSKRLSWESGKQALMRDPELVAELTPPDTMRSEVARAAIWTCRDCDKAGMFLHPSLDCGTPLQPPGDL